jgi:uncharacterized membrane protein
MRAKANIGGHPIHTMLVAFPVGLWVFSLVADLIYMWRGNPAWEYVTFYTLAGGCVGAVLAAVFGLIDLLGVKDTQAFRTGVMHAGCVVVSLLIFAASFYLRTASGSNMVGASSKIPVVLSFLGVIVLSVGGWLGGELVFRYGAGIDPAARINT